MFLSLLLCTFLQANAAFTVPTLTGPVVDQAGIMDPEYVAFLDNNLRRLNQEKQIQIQVLTTPTLDNLSIEEAALQVVDQWKLGSAKGDKGLLLLVAPSERRLRFEVGQGLEGDLPDITAKRIIDQVITPRFQNRQMSLGIVEGVVTAVNKAAPDFQFQDAPVIQRQATRERGRPSWIFILVLLFILFKFLGGGGGRRRGISPLGAFALGGLAGRGSSGFGGGGFGGGGGGWGGGGGGFSGGGASGGW
ncbi:MAG: TPM domain-containing protein [Bdellovibrionota bacterium]